MIMMGWWLGITMLRIHKVIESNKSTHAVYSRRQKASYTRIDCVRSTTCRNATKSSWQLPTWIHCLWPKQTVNCEAAGRRVHAWTACVHRPQDEKTEEVVEGDGEIVARKGACSPGAAHTSCETDPSPAPIQLAHPCIHLLAAASPTGRRLISIGTCTKLACQDFVLLCIDF